MSELQYKVGQKVRVRKDLQRSRTYYMKDKYANADFTSHMESYKGKVFTIESADSRYTLKEVGFTWTDGMLESVDTSESQMISDVRDIQIVANRVIYSEKNTILFYKVEGKDKIQKVIAKCIKEDEFSKEKGLEVAFLKAFRKEVSNRLRKM